MPTNKEPAPNDTETANDDPLPNVGVMANNVPVPNDGAMASEGPMIGVTAHYFAVFREQAGTAAESLTTRATTAAELYAEVADRHGLKDPVANCKVAINDELAGWDRPLSEGDSVLFFPPVAGG